MRGLPLIKAPDEDNGLAAARRLFRWRDDVNVEDEETRRTGVGLLFWSSLSDNLEAVHALGKTATTGGRWQKRNDTLREKGELFSVFQKGVTSLHVACMFSSYAVVEALLDQGLRVTAKTNVGSTPLHAAGEKHSTRFWLPLIYQLVQLYEKRVGDSLWLCVLLCVLCVKFVQFV